MVETKPLVAEPTYRLPESFPWELKKDVVHVWRASLDEGAVQVGALSATLSSDELQRARRIRFEQHRVDFVVGRGILRRLLGFYLRISPREIGFVYGRKGKPSLAAGFDRRLRFNVSHSGRIFLCAVAWDHEVGVDVEQLRPVPDWEAVAACVFTPRELAALRALDGRERERAFYRCWTRKEAFVKADGDGFALPIREMEVGIAQEERAKILRGPGRPADLGRWRLHDLSPAPGYVGAVVVGVLVRRLHCWGFDPDSARVVTGTRRYVEPQ